MEKVKPKYIISSCLVGVKCRYNGTCSSTINLEDMIQSGEAIPICPEVIGGLPTPREPVEIQQTEDGIRVTNKAGNDYTPQFLKSAEEVLKICQDNGITNAILQSRSPSCGFGKIYDGTFSGKLIEGNGVVADKLFKNGISVMTDEEVLYQV
ncbi:DUF523 domain-containing protein [Flammeovirga sp. MY04]|uniref:DUF523 domain-containing protein n=1 Tax=Flammeovirga sp. MY04 TaxID=1191459 RepID=UPI00080617D9|nr:DUF523 domain-containing protein [Flammeovirga sp. MY04]ANQ51900.1 DUF523 domain-containing protein [Flammeovirga sp. MY04]